MEQRTRLHLGVVAIEKGTFGSPSTKIANFTYSLYFFSGHVMLCNSSIKSYKMNLVNAFLSGDYGGFSFLGVIFKAFPNPFESPREKVQR